MNVGSYRMLQADAVAVNLTVRRAARVAETAVGIFVPVFGS